MCMYVRRIIEIDFRKIVKRVLLSGVIIYDRIVCVNRAIWLLNEKGLNKLLMKSISWTDKYTVS